MKYKRIKAALLILLFLMAGVFYSTDRNQNFEVSDTQETVVVLESESLSESEDLTSQTASVSDTETAGESSSGNMMHIHVCGAVKKSGVYELPEGAIVEDAIELAGGIVKSGASDYLNLAQKLEDGEKVYVPYTKELEEGDSAGNLSGSSQGTQNLTTGESGDSSDTGTGLVNINTATKEELTTLNGIGDARAQAIIDYRTENGSFASIEDIMLVSGIKEGAFAKIKDQITV